MKDILKVATGVVLGLLIFSVFAVIGGKIYLNGSLFGGDLSDVDESNSNTSAWIENVYTDPLDDTETLSIYVQEEGSSPLFDDPPEFYINCIEDTVEVYISWQEYVDVTSEVAVRIDDGEIDQQHWDVSVDETVSYYPGQPKDFISKLIESERLVVRTTSFNGSTLTSIFETSGLDEAIQPVRSACPW